MNSVLFLPVEKTVSASCGDTLLDVALANKVALEHECGGNCACTTCLVDVVDGFNFLSAMEDVEFDRLIGAEGVNPTSRLGCQALILGGNVTVRIAS